jgi:osmotically-inducible protein OsmY
VPLLAEVLARQIEGIAEVRDLTGTLSAQPDHDDEAAREAVQFLFATDQTLRTGLQVSAADGQIILEGAADSPAQRNWAELLAGSVGARLVSRLQTGPLAVAAPDAIRPPDVDDESLEAMILFRLRLVRETEHLPVRVKALRGVVTLQGKVRSEALRQKVENLARSTLGLKELRSSLSLAP